MKAPAASNGHVEEDAGARTGPRPLSPLEHRLLVSTPPSDGDAEAAAIACALVGGDAVADRIHLLSGDDFYELRNRCAWESIRRTTARGAAPDVLIVLRDLESRGVLEAAGGNDRLAELAALPFTPANFSHYADRIRRLARQRAQIRIGAELVRAGYGEGATELRLAIEDLEALRADEPLVTASRFVRVADMNPDEHQVEWLVRGYLARGNTTLLHAIPKAGKSTFAYALVAALERGDSTFIDCASLGPCTTVILSEESTSAVLEKCQAFGIQRATVLTREKAYPRRSFAADMTDAIETARAMPDCGLLLVDVWRFWARLADKQENDSGATEAAFSEIRRAAAAGFAVLLLHHSRKGGGSDGESAAGTNGLPGGVDIEVEMKRFREGGTRGERTDDSPTSTRVLQARGRFRRIPEEVVIDFRDDRYVAVGAAVDARRALLEGSVLRALADARRWLTPQELKTEGRLGPHIDKIRAALADAHRTGKVQRAGGVKGAPVLYAALDVPLHAQPSRTAAAS